MLHGMSDIQYRVAMRDRDELLQTLDSLEQERRDVEKRLKDLKPDHRQRGARRQPGAWLCTFRL